MTRRDLCSGACCRGRLPGTAKPQPREPTWPPIIIAAIGAAAVVALTWWGGLFEGLLTRLTGGVL